MDKEPWNGEDRRYVEDRVKYASDMYVKDRLFSKVLLVGLIVEFRGVKGSGPYLDGIVRLLEGVKEGFITKRQAVSRIMDLLK